MRLVLHFNFRKCGIHGGWGSRKSKASQYYVDAVEVRFFRGEANAWDETKAKTANSIKVHSPPKLSMDGSELENKRHPTFNGLSQVKEIYIYIARQIPTYPPKNRGHRMERRPTLLARQTRSATRRRDTSLGQAFLSSAVWTAPMYPCDFCREPGESTDQRKSTGIAPLHLHPMGRP